MGKANLETFQSLRSTNIVIHSLAECTDWISLYKDLVLFFFGSLRFICYSAKSIHLRWSWSLCSGMPFGSCIPLWGIPTLVKRYIYICGWSAQNKWCIRCNWLKPLGTFGARLSCTQTPGCDLWTKFWLASGWWNAMDGLPHFWSELMTWELSKCGGLGKLPFLGLPLPLSG
jgi:hypothetical protein